MTKYQLYNFEILDAYIDKKITFRELGIADRFGWSLNRLLRWRELNLWHKIKELFKNDCIP